MLSKTLTALLLVAASSVALADAYVCRLPDKSRVVQSEPCASPQSTISSARSSALGAEEQRANSDRAKADMQRQSEFFYRQRMIEAAGREPSRKTLTDAEEDHFNAIRANNEVDRLRQQRNTESNFPQRR